MDSSSYVSTATSTLEVNQTAAQPAEGQSLVSGGSTILAIAQPNAENLVPTYLERDVTIELVCILLPQGSFFACPSF
jgi:hypothetical protein